MSNYIEWDESLSTNIVEIDADHKRIIGCINRLHQAMLDNRGKEVQREIIFELSDYADSHFKLEEGYMERFGFDGLEAHRDEHQQLAKEVADLRSKADKGALLMSITILSFLKNWLNNHILGTDMKYLSTFSQHGLK